MYSLRLHMHEFCCNFLCTSVKSLLVYSFSISFRTMFFWFSLYLCDNIHHVVQNLWFSCEMVIYLQFGTKERNRSNTTYNLHKAGNLSTTIRI